MQDLDSIVDWSNTWLMRFNATERHLLKIIRQRKPSPTSYSYNIKGVQLQKVDHLPYLGFDLSSDLTWKNHISNITSKVNAPSPSLWLQSGIILSRAFKSLAPPHHEYSTSVWDPYFKQDILAIEKVLRKGVHSITNNYSYRDSVASM